MKEKRRRGRKIKRGRRRNRERRTVVIKKVKKVKGQTRVCDCREETNT